jgi:long-chain acyl-CoA synthetase
VESALALHPWVLDIAVIGVPNADLGEEVKAVVVASDAAPPPDELTAGLMAYARERIAHYKCPVSVDVVDELPRLPTGKLLKRQLRDRYWPS